MRPDKAQKYMVLAEFFANQFSKDPSTKVGAMLLDPESLAIRSRGYNGMPRGVDESRPGRQERPLKYAFYEHAERNAIFNKVRPLLAGSIVVTTGELTPGCVRAMLSVGVSSVFCPLVEDPSPSLQAALSLFDECGVTLHPLPTLSKEAFADKLTRKVASFAAVAHHQAQVLSKDPKAAAALFVSPGDFTILAEGYSGLPRGADDSRIERFEQPLRERWVEPCVRNAIYNAARPFLEGSAALVTATTCVECARGLAAVGIVEVICRQPSADLASRWGPDFRVALDMLEELGVKTTELASGLECGHRQPQAGHPGVRDSLER